MKIRAMQISDYESVYKIWETSLTGPLLEDDNKENIEIYLNRNIGLSKVAIIDEKIVGAVLVGHDGRAGYIHRLAVNENYRRLNVAKEMVEKAEIELKELGIKHIFLFCGKKNEKGQNFWKKLDFNIREDIFTFFK